MAESRPWAIILCRFTDTNAINLNFNLANQLFTPAGAATFNMTRFFTDMSHGAIDIDGSQVFPAGLPYITVNLPVNSYVEPSPKPPGWKPSVSRDQLIQKVVEAAVAAGVPISDFYGVCAIFNDPIGIAFGGASSVGPFAVGDHRYLDTNGTTTFAHEFGHAFGLPHSRIAGSTEEAKDLWDIMSAMNCYWMEDADYGQRGPGMNAANMRSMDWLDQSRVWHGPDEGFDSVVELRPLHRRDLPGFLAIEFPRDALQNGLTVEFRTRALWDAAIPRAAVFVHSAHFGPSYLQRSTFGAPDLGVGDIFETPPGLWMANRRVEVLDISASNDTATVRVSLTPGDSIPGDWHGIPRHVIGQTPFDGPGYRWTGRRFVPIPPWNPMAALYASLDEWSAAAEIKDVKLRQEVFRNIIARMKIELDRADAEFRPIRSPAPLDPAFARSRRKTARRKTTKRPKQPRQS